MNNQSSLDEEKIQTAIARLNQSKARLEILSHPPSESESDEDRLRRENERTELTAEITKNKENISAALTALVVKMDQKLGSFVANDLGFLLFSDKNGGSLGDKPNISKMAKVRINDQTLEDAVRRLTDMVTMRHIKEEMDSNKYLNRVDGQFNRLVEESGKLAEKIGQPGSKKVAQKTGQAENGGENATGLLAQLEQAENYLETAFPKDDLREFSTTSGDVTLMKAKLKAIKNLLVSLRGLTKDDLALFCQEANRGYVRHVTHEAAVKAEKSGMSSLFVLGAGALAFPITEVGIMQSRSLSLMDNRMLILTLAVGGMTALSMGLGAWNRNRRITTLNRRMQERLADLIALKTAEERRSLSAEQCKKTPAPLRPFRFIWRRGQQAVQPGSQAGNAGSPFKRLDLSSFANAAVSNCDNKVSTRFDIDRQIEDRTTKRRGALVFAGNIAALGAIYLMLTVLWPMTAKLGGSSMIAKLFDAPNKTLLGNAGDGSPCVLETGEILRINDDYLLIDNKNLGTVRVDRDRIWRVETARDGKMEVERGLQRCDVKADLQTETVQAPEYNFWLPATDENGHVSVGSSDALTGLSGSLDRLAETIGSATAQPAPPIVLTVQQPAATLGLPTISIFINGTELPIKPDRNAMLMPLFPWAVQTIGQTGRDGAYDYGRRSLDGGNYQSEVARKFLEIVFPRILTCVGKGGRVDLDIVGYASQSWSHPQGSDPNLLNLYLAEGRRAAVLKSLWRSIPHGQNGIAKGIRIISASGDPIPLSEVMAASRPTFRFLNDAGQPEPEFMMRHLSDFVGDADGQVLGSDIHELLSRSVLIRVVGVNGPNCAGQQDPVEVLQFAPTPQPEIEATLR